MMANISVRGLDERRLKELKQEALAEGVSLNRRVLELLEGARPKPKSAGHHELNALIGSWSQKDQVAFTAAVAPFEAIDPALWD